MATTGSTNNLHRSNQNLAHDNENKKKAAAAQTAVEKKRASLDARHRYLLEKFAAFVDEKPATLENSLLVGNKLDLINDFFAEGGSRKVLFFWQKDDSSTAKTAAAAANQTKPNTLIVTLGNKEVLTGLGAFFIRPNTKAITPQNIFTDISFGPLNSNLLPSLTSMVKYIIMPALRAQDNWGVLARQKDESVKGFMEVLEKFTGDIDVAMVNLHDSVQLHPCTIDLEAFKKPYDYANAAHNPEVINALEGLVNEWCKQIEQVLAESEQMRKEADDIGPNAELAHWKARMVKFNSITDQLKSPVCKKVIGILNAVKSRALLKTWKDLDDRVTDAANESKDNVKYLYTLERFCDPLYRSDPLGMIPAIPGLINAIKMIYSISRYYNTSERMTSLFVKITNQMITSCKEFVYKDGGSKIWDLDRQVLVQKLMECHKLNEAYQRCFHEIKKKLQETPQEKQFDFSEMYIFGKFDAFCKRIQKVIDMFNIIEKFSLLENLGVEGMDSIVRKFSNILTQMQRKPYDILDHRKMEYDSDYNNFKKQVSDLEATLQQFIDSSFEHISSTEQSLELLSKFSQIKDMQLDLESKYHSVFVHYTRKDLEGVRKLYQKYKDLPPIPRNTPPVSGAIAWARQLYRRIENPMKHFKSKTSVLDSAEAKKHIRNYNKLARALIEFEVLWHRSWYNIVEQAKTGLQATLLVSNGEGQVYVNFDPQIIQLIKETKYMLRLGLEVPESVKNVCTKEMYYKGLYNGLVHILQNKKRVLERVSNILRRAMAPHIDELDRTLQPGLTALTWTSLNLDDYLQANHKQLAKLEELVDKLLDISECRIEMGVRKIAEISLVEVPADTEQWSVDIFFEKTEKRCSSMIQTISNRSNLIESATRDMIAELSKGVAQYVNPDLRLAYESVYYNANYQNFEALVQCTKGSLDMLRARLGTYTSNQYNKAPSQKPFFRAEIVLLIPNVVLQPKLEDIQAALNRAAGMVIDVAKKLSLNWRVFLDAPEDHATAHYPEDTSQVANNKDVLKVMMMLSSTVNSMKKDVESHREQFGKYDFLWKEDKAETIQKFLDSNPTISDFENEINRYEFIEREIVEIPGSTQIGLLLISAEPLKLALLSETKEWKQQYGLNLNRKVKTDMEQLIEYMESKTIKLSRKIADIDDLRIAVQTLSEIREAEVDIDMKVAPIEEAYLLLTKHNVSVTREETEMVDSLRYSWKKLKMLVIDTQAHLSKIQPVFKADLLGAVQKFSQDVKEFTVEYTENGPMAGNIPPKTASERLNVFQRGFDELNRKWETYSGGEELFCLPVTPFPTLVRIKKELKLLQNLYSLYNDVLEKRQTYNETLWADIDLEKINTEMTDFQNKIKKLPKAIKDWDAFTELKNIVENLAAMVPLLEMMCNKAMQQRHWDSIMAITKTQINLDPDMFYLKNLLDAPLVQFREDIEDICTAAVKEADIEVKLKATVVDWEDKNFTLAGFKTRGNLILKPSATSEIISQMEDSLMTLASLMSNRYNAPFKPTIQTWVHNLSTASEVIENWLAVQNLWIYLEAVFVGGDIAKQMPKEAKRFSNIDKSWCKIMGLANEHPNVIQCCVLDETIANLLPHLTEQLELCQKSLSGYLESKRAIFPRFYFVSDPALLEVLGQASDSHTIQAHLKSVFDNIDKVQFHDKEYDKIIGMESSEGERVPLSRPMLAAGNVEVWLGTLLKSMQTSINDIIREAAARVNDVQTQKFMDEYPAQIGLLCLQIQWTQMCEEALTLSKTDKKKMGATNQRIIEILNILIEVTTKDLSKMDRTKYETLITIQVHHRDVFEKLYKSHVKSPDDFEWLKQARFYWQETKDCCIVSITNFDFKYQCEYLGCCDRLVITPLTDRCYITLAQALGMSLGGSPAGPAGTGKCWGRGTRLVMLDGTAKAVEEICEGDVLMGPDSQPRIVRPGSITRGTEAMYRVTATDDARISWTCNGPHILVLQLNDKPTVVAAGGRFFVKTWTTRPGTSAVSQIPCADLVGGAFATRNDAEAFIDELVRTEWQPLVFECTVIDYLAIKDESLRRSLAMFQPPLIEWPSPAVSLAARISEMRGPEASLAMVAQIAWAIGAWLALSTGSGRVEICEQVHSEFERIAAMLGEGMPGKCESAFSELIGSYGLAQATNIPHELMTECPAVRRALLAGLVDCSGRIGEDGGCTITSASAGILTDAASLARGLGLVVGKSHEHASIAVRGAGLTAVAEHIVTDDKRRAVAELASGTQGTDSCFGFTIECVGFDDYFGFSLDGRDGRCLLADYTVTHNTESVKDLGKNIGLWVVVFNCSDQMDYRGLGRIYKGLAQSGCWGCFDEFNRIELPVLSVAAQQIGCVFSARKERKTSFLFTDGDVVELKPEVAMFITMNPGYAGRVELPENLKVHFRYVAMMVPDRQIIIRVKLAGCGFISNLILAKKFFVLYRLCEEQLSKQVHYDFGLRNILSVLRTCGSVKRANPDDSENLIIMRVLRDMNLSKLVDEDEALFLSLVNDLFPGLTAKKGSYPNVEAAVDQQLAEANLISHPPWTLKVIQLYETAKVRHGIMILGPTGTGKCWGRGTRLVMLDGTTKAVEEICEGDVLVGPDSKPRAVLTGSITRGFAPMFRIAPAQPGRQAWTCNEDHILVVRLPIEPFAAQNAPNGDWSVVEYVAAPGSTPESFVPRLDHVKGGFGSRADAEAFARDRIMSAWTPLEFECTIRDYMSLDETIRSALVMFQPGAINWPAPQRGLAHELEALLGASHVAELVLRSAWALGVWIARGIEGSPSVRTSGMCDTAEHDLSKLAVDLGGLSHKLSDRIDLGDRFAQLLKRLAMLTGKRIPQTLHQESQEIRGALLAGWIDGAAVSSDALHIQIHCGSHEAAEDLARLARGLGLAAIPEAAATNDARAGPILCVVAVVGHQQVYEHIRRRMASVAAAPAKLDAMCSKFTVTRLDADFYYGFELSGDGRCLISDFTVTHNTKCINALLKAMTACGDPHKELRMNPKAITDYQMFGKLDVATNDWTDGIFSSLWRKTLKRKGETVWIVLDGPVDAVWIENLNSVLDDNKCLTLANGDRIPMSPACKLTFEVHSLRNASPATVSRCGMIYIGVTALTWDIVLQSWFKTRPANEVGVLEALFNGSFGAVNQFMILELHPKMIIAQVNYVVNATILLTGLIPKAEANKSQISSEHLERLYVYALFWAFGSLLELDERKKLQQFMLEKLPDLKYPPIDPSSQDTFYEFFVNDNGQWQHWRDRVVDWLYPQDTTPEFSSIIIPMVDNVRTEFMMETVTKQGRPVLLIGEPGTAKTVTVKKYLAKLNPDTHLSKNLSFSSATTPMIFQRTIESYLDKRMGSTYGPPAGKKMIIFIDDINMPEINEWGDQVTGEIVRQLMEYQGFYSLDRPGDWTAIVDLFFLGAMMHPGGGRNDIPSRLKRQFVVLNCTIPSDVSVDKIFGTMLEGHFCAARNFAPDVIAMAARLPPLTRRLWQMTKVKMLPTPAKFHYIFNLRDLSRIVEGMLNSTPDAISSDKLLLNLWEHECSRVLPDRFITQEDVDWFNKAIINIVQKDLGDDYVGVVSTKSYFVDFMREPPENDDPEVEIDLEAIKVYERVPSFEVLRERLLDYMKQYNENIRGSKMDLVLFEDAMRHIVRISRIIRTPRGNALLVGVGGSGKQSLTKLAAFIAKSQVFQIAITKNYNVSNLMEDLKLMYKVAGAQGKSMTFIFTDNEVKEEGFLGFINNILTSGEITNLFPKDEIISISSDLRGPLKKQRPNVIDTIENLWQFFIDRVKANLHVVLCFSPVGDKFRNRSLKFPGLVSGCTMDWFSRWPNEALRAVADKFVAEMEIVCTDQIKKEVVYHMAFVHDLVTDACNNYFMQFRRRTHVTPKSYLSFLGSYKSYYKSKRDEVGSSSDRMNMGLSKLVEASKSVAVLQDQLVVKEKELAIASKAADAVLAEVTASTTAAEKVKDAVLKVKTKSESIANMIKGDKEYAESQLEAAKPALEEARNALNSIQPSHISTVRKLAKPPHLIMRIMDGVLLLMKRKIDTITQDPDKPCMKPSWSESLKLMSASDFLTNLLNFPKDEINEETVEFLEPLMEMPDFNLEGAKKVSADVAGLASWVGAMAVYYSVNKKVIPLKANLIVQEHKLAIAMEDLNKAQQMLDEKQAELDVFQAKYNEAISNKQALQADADSCKRKMNAATALISGLKGEKDRWTIQSKEFAERIGRLVGDIILATAFLSYSGPFNQTFRSQLLQDWRKELLRRKIPHTEDLDIIGLLVDNTTVGEWNIQGLPTDELSIQNGIIVTKGTRFPLLIDPQNQAKVWIKNREEQNKLQVTTLSHKYFRQHIEDCVSQGRPLLIEDVEETLDPTLDNILERNLIKAGRGFKVVFGDKEIDWCEGFYVFITTKLPNPNYNPEIYAKCSIIDFTVTSKGLEEQLLGRVIMREKQELETERAKLLEEVNSNKRKMKQLEDNLLERLTSTKGSLVDDESLIEVLAVTKTTAEEVNEKLVVAAETQKKIGSAREEYRPVASRGSIIYFLIAEMSMVNVMYQTSLKQFLQLFDESMEKGAPSPIPSKRIQNIIEYCTFRAFSYITRGLYEIHKVIFVLLLALKIDIFNGKVTHEEFRCLIKGGAALDINAVVKKPFNWIPDMTWLNLVALSKMPGFTDVLNQVGKNEKAWRSWYEKDAPENEVLPGGYQNSLDAFRRLLLVRSWCLDRTGMMAKQYIASSMTTRFAESQILDLDALLGESNNRTPMICLLSQGSDPSSDIENLSKKYKIDMKAISMGQGQEVHARKLLSAFMLNGGWALLQNCHLGLPFMDELLGLILETEVIHEKFRLWITTDVSPKFPITFLQMSIKFTNEPPQGIKAGLKRTYAWFTQDMLDMSARPQYKPLLYGLAFLHSIVQERRKFGPLGWNIPYEFNQSDLAASVQFVQNHVDELAPKANISWTTARFMFCEVHYGGRVTDDFDRRLLQTYGKVWFGDHMFLDSFCFYKGYTIPHLKTIEEYRQSIESLPLIDTPDAFGLHPNADISCQTKESQRMLDTIMSIQPKDSNTGSGETREEVVKRMANDLLSKLPESFDKNRTKIQIQKQGGPKPLNIFLGQEIDRMQVVISAVKSTLSDLKLAIDGTIIMAPALQNALDALYDARVPDSWVKISWQSSTLGLWYTEFLSRAAQFHTWLYDGRPLVFWLSGFFNPQGFLTAIRQEITRVHNGWALDSVKLAPEVMKQMKEDISAPPAEGVYIHGLFIEGAAWDRKNIRLTESQPKIIFQSMPVVHVSATNSTDDGDPRMYRCPVYRRPRRTDQNYIFDIELKTQQNPDYWILRGIALLCATS